MERYQLETNTFRRNKQSAATSLGFVTPQAHITIDKINFAGIIELLDHTLRMVILS